MNNNETKTNKHLFSATCHS